MSAYETVIGLEVHAQLRTRSKLFSSAPTTYGAEPNTQASLVDLGFPGTLPVINAAVLDMAIAFGLACDAQIPSRSIFARKNYFYPDLPKGYQISQFEHPVVGPGTLSIRLADGKQKSIGITRAHLEEDAGKSVHDRFAGSSAIDLNRAGTPLLEIVSEPDMRSSAEAVAYLRTLHTLVRFLGICDGNMAEGSFRCDANVSVRPRGATELGTRTELKNLNSFRFVERAIEIEVERQIDLIEEGGSVVQQTRLYDESRDETRAMRSKEEANDYRYFPDPDLLPVSIDETRIARVRETLPELPQARRERYRRELALSDYDADVLMTSRETADYFEALLATDDIPPKLAANWVAGELMGALNADGLTIRDSRVSAQALAQLLTLIQQDTISGKIAKDVFAAMWRGEGGAQEIVERDGLRQISDSGELEAIVDNVLESNAPQAQQYRDGKHQVIGFLVGKVMQQTRGKANPAKVNELLRARLGGDA
ncbi:MAG: Asp-tRNA(Asn)/Glu-tRNA(Gln) amidotransferase subunit GatB [Gammaproteobacteria bacterium]